jgi:hypothetical protein
MRMEAEVDCGETTSISGGCFLQQLLRPQSYSLLNLRRLVGCLRNRMIAKTVKAMQFYYTEGNLLVR